jgi:hypothetical protein
MATAIHGYQIKAQTTISGNLALSSNVSTDHSYSGMCTTMTVTTNPLGFGCALRATSSGTLVNAVATGTLTMPCVVMALETGTGSKNVMLQGFVRDDSWSWAIGGYVYVSTASGALTQTAPSSTGQIVQVLGTAVQTNEIFFNPNYITIEIA